MAPCGGIDTNCTLPSPSSSVPDCINSCCSISEKESNRDPLRRPDPTRAVLQRSGAVGHMHPIVGAHAEDLGDDEFVARRKLKARSQFDSSNRSSFNQRSPSAADSPTLEAIATTAFEG